MPNRQLRFLLEFHSQLGQVMKMRFLKKTSFVVLIVTLLISLGCDQKQKAARPDELQASSAVTVTQDQEVCFSPGEECDTKLIQFIQSAKKSIDVAIYDINLVAVIHALMVQSKKIQVRLIVDRRQARESHSGVPTLLKLGANVRYGHQRGIFHNKFMIADGKKLETGSFNYTLNAAQNNNENQVYLTNPPIVDQYSKHFEELWAQAVPVEN
jgi:phosphatidylserine/phosphatidylglycerophosphate/cardiolipin synthase-like enzyme